MAKSKSCRLIVDASVAQAAGGANARAEVSKAYRETLQAMLQICHRLVLTREMQQEWNKHQSGFARTWRVSMVARKKFESTSDKREDLWNLIAQLTAREQDIDIMKKDFHLIEAALATDLRVLSLDQEARSLFDGMAVKALELRDIVWVNPAMSEEESLAWLKKGAPLEKRRRLGCLH